MSKDEVNDAEIGLKPAQNPNLEIAKQFLMTRDGKPLAVKPIIFGISGKILTKDEIKFFQKNPVFGFILFKRNIESEEQFVTLIQSLKDLYPERAELFISIDQEGGRVARLQSPVIKQKYPPAAKLSESYKENKAETLHGIEENYTELMAELKKFGVVCPYAPVADIFYKGADYVIGDRSFGDNVARVVDCARAAIDGIKQAGGVPVIKHIPGHGRASVDSHFDLPVVTATIDDLNQTDFEVFRQLAYNEKNPNGAQWAMTAHVIFETLDKDKPVTLSKNAIEFIRKKIGFQGILITDAIEMMALHQNIEWIKNDQGKIVPKSVEEFCKNLATIATESLAAGCDLVLHCTGQLGEMTVIAEAVQIICSKSSNFNKAARLRKI